jgi:hypothetical protein
MTVLSEKLTSIYPRKVLLLEKFHVIVIIMDGIRQGFQSGPVPGTFTRLRSCIVPAEITEPPKISGGQNHKYDGR